jgi:uncharacterized membrane-anchored protein
MKLPFRHIAPTETAEITGPARVDRRVGAVLRKAGAGDIVVVDHLDLDRNLAEALLRHGVAAVVNASPFLSGRYPALGPEVLARGGVLLIDSVGLEVFGAVKDGSQVRIVGGALHVGERVAAEGRLLDVTAVQELMEQARTGLNAQLQALAHNTTEFLRREQELLLHGRGIPDLATVMEDRPVVVVVRDFDHEADLRRLRRFIREQRPVLVGVDLGADTLLAAGHRPDLAVVGQAGFTGLRLSQDSVSDEALTTAREVVVHADAADRVVGAERLDRLGVRAQRISASGTTEDIALLVAENAGASVIVTVGTHATLDEFLDRQRSGLASTFLTRLKVGPRLVDARTVPALYAGRVRSWHLLLPLLVGLLAVAVAVAVTPQGEVWLDGLRDLIDSIRDSIKGLFS